MIQGGPALGDRPRGQTSTGEGGRRSKFSFNTFTSLKNPAYRLYFLALLGQMGAMNMQMVARSAFMYELTGRTSLLGALALANALPILSLSLFGGVLADRVKKKQVLIIGQAASVLVALGIGVAITFGSITWVHLIVASLLQGIVMALMMPARQSIIPELVGERTLMNALALNAAAMNLLRLLAPAVAGFVIAFTGFDTVYYIMAGLYLVGLVFILRLPITGVVARRARDSSVIRELGDGLRYIRGNANVLGILIFTLLATLLSMPYFFLLPAFTKDILIVDPASLGGLTTLPLVGGLFAQLGDSTARLGLLIAVSGIGALVGSLIVASMPNKRRGVIYLLSVLLMGVALVAFTFTGSFMLALLIFIPLGLGQAGRMALSNTLVQSYTEDAYRGRVMSVYMMEWGVTNVGVFIVGVLADFVGVQMAVGGAAALLVAVSLYYLMFNRRLRQLD